MKVSVVVPVRNNQKMIGDCIESLLEQDFPKEEYEIIVVDNDSTDKTAESIKKYQVKYLFEGMKGRTKARNKGIKNSTGEIVAFIDSDCIADRNWLKEIVKRFANKDVGGVGGKSLGHNISNLAERYAEIMYNEFNKNFSSINPPRIRTNNAAFRADILEEVGYFDESFETGEDYDLSLRVFWQGYTIEFEPNAIVYHRHRNSIRKLFTQYFEYGRGNVRLNNKHKNKLDSKKKRGDDFRLYYRILTDPKISPDTKTKLYFYLCINAQNFGFSLGKMFEKSKKI